MVKKIYVYSLFIFIIFTLSCTEKSNEKEIQFSNFPDEKILKGSKAEMEELPLKLYQIEKLDSLLIAFDYYREGNRLYIFNSNNISLLETAGTIGKGPKELTSPFFFDIDKGRKMIWLGDRGKVKIFGFSIDSILQSGKELPTREIKLNEKLRHFNRIRIYNDSLFAVSPILSEETPELIKLINHQGEVVDSLGEFPEKRKKDEPKFGFQQLWQSNIRVLPEKGILISFRNFDKIMQIDSTGDTKFLTSGPDHITQERKFHKNKYWMNIKDRTKRGYGPSYKHNKHFYCLYSGKLFFNQNEYNTTQKYFKKINVFNEGGEPVSSYKLNYEIRDFVIDEKNKRIIGIGTSTKTPFVIFPLPEIKN